MEHINMNTSPKLFSDLIEIKFGELKFNEVDNMRKTTWIQVLRECSIQDPRYGKVEVTSKMLYQMKENFDKDVRGIKISLDEAHDSDRRAYAWFKKLDVRDVEGKKELWAEVELNSLGTAALSDKQYAYISADFDSNYIDNETGINHGCVLLGAALTNRPVVKRMVSATTLSEIDASKANAFLLANDAFREKVKKLIAEGYSQDQALAIAYAMLKKGELNETQQGEDSMNELEKKKLDEYSKLETDLGVKDPAALMAMVGGLKSEIETLKKDKQLAEKTSRFNTLMAEGKAVEAQRESFLAGDMEKFISLQKSVKLSENGHGGKGGDTKEASEDEAYSKCEKRAEELMKENKNLKFSEALKQAKKELTK
jgi:uncharacterized protein YoaH (UPF0181 family)